MEGLARDTRGVWSKASLKADAAWGPRRQAEAVALRRSRLAATVFEMRARAKEINARMRGRDVARKHALDALAAETDPFSALLERFDMACAEEESDYAQRLWATEEHRREQIVLRYRQAWAARAATASLGSRGGHSSAHGLSRGSLSPGSGEQREQSAARPLPQCVAGPPRRAPVRRVDGKTLRGSDVRQVLLRVARNPSDLAFQARAFERLLALAAWQPACARDCLHFGVLAKACHLLADALHALGVQVPGPGGSLPSAESASGSHSASSPSSASAAATATRGQPLERPKCVPASEEEALAVCRPAVGLMATLVASDETAGLQMDALSGFELAAAAVGRFPLDAHLQRHVCGLIRARCGDDTGRTVAGSATGNINGRHGTSLGGAAGTDEDDDEDDDRDDQADDGSSLGSATTLLDRVPHGGEGLYQPSLATSVSGRIEADYYPLDFDVGAWVDPSTNGRVPSALSILTRVLALHLGLPLKCLRQQARALRRGAEAYLAAKPEKAIEAKPGRPPLGTALTPAEEEDEVARPGVGTTRVPWGQGEEALVARMEEQQRRRPADLPALHAALLALKAFATNLDENKTDALRCGALPLLLALLRAAGHNDRVLLPRAAAAALCAQALGALRALLWTPNADAPTSSVAFDVASQVVAAGGVGRMAEAVKVHSGDPAVATAAQQLLQALMAALAPGPPSASAGGFGLGFAFESGGGGGASAHAWHLRHCGGGSKAYLAMITTALTTWHEVSPLVWLAATNLATLLAGSTPLVQGNLQSALLAFQGCSALVQCLAVNLYDPFVAEALCRALYCVVACGPRGNLLRNELKAVRAADALFKCSAVHAGVNGQVLHWASAAKEIILSRTHEE